jgi:acetyl-CoA carboxylase biotin carboxyl carrier protein
MSNDQKQPLDFEDVQQILRILEKSTFDELQIEIGEFRLTLRRGGGSPQSTSATGETHREPGASDSSVPGPQPSALPPSHTAELGLIEIRAPMLGTFYRAPRPSDPPFVEVGTKVQHDATIGIIEVMKLMNAVQAGVVGEIKEICVHNGELVEFDQVLMRIAPS